MGSRSPMDPDNLDASERARRALALRRDGQLWHEIADELGYADRAAAYNAAKRLLDRTEFESVEEYRAVEADRLDEAHRIQLQHLAQFRPSQSGVGLSAVASAVGAIVRISERRSKLLGLDAPTKVDVGSSSIDLDGTVAAIMSALQADAGADADDGAIPGEGA